MTVLPLPMWDSAGSRATFGNNRASRRFWGGELQKCDQDLKRYEHIVAESNPDLIVETGTRYGSSAAWFKHRLWLDVITIDIENLIPVAKMSRASQGITFVQGVSSIAPQVVDTVRERIKGRRVMVSLDSDHHAAHVVQEIQLYSQFVSPGCHLVVEDGCFDMWEGHDARVGGARIPEEGGPLKAIELAGLPVDPRFSRDIEVESLSPISHSPAGWWRRVG